MGGKRKIDWKREVFTIPNLLSFFRLLLIPLLIWLYVGRKEYVLSFIVVLVSALTDTFDGMIARKFNMISDIGKMLDPIADKATQAAVLLALSSRYKVMLYLAILLIVKEVLDGILFLYLNIRTKEVHGAQMHGKIATWVLYFTMLLHLLWVQIPQTVTYVLAALCAFLVVLSLILYAISGFRQIRQQREQEAQHG